MCLPWGFQIHIGVWIWKEWGAHRRPGKNHQDQPCDCHQVCTSSMEIHRWQCSERHQGTLKPLIYRSHGVIKYQNFLIQEVSFFAQKLWQAVIVPCNSLIQLWLPFQAWRLQSILLTNALLVCRGHWVDYKWKRLPSIRWLGKLTRVCLPWIIN